MSLPGESLLVGLIGSGITRSLTPPLHERAADRAGLRCLYRPVDLDALPGRAAPARAEEALDLLDAAQALGFDACNVTHPCKQLVLDGLDEVSETARRLGAVNTVLLRGGRKIGHNTDVTGFAAALAEGLPGADLSRVVQIGTGGAGSATAHAVLAAGAEELLLADLSPDRAEDAARRCAEAFPRAMVRAIGLQDLAAVLPRTTGLINATPLGMHHHPGSPLDTALLHPGLWVADVVYLPQETELILAARALGCPVLPGGWMAVGQAVDAYELISGVRPDAEAMRRDFAELIEQQQGPGASGPTEQAPPGDAEETADGGRA